MATSGDLAGDEKLILHILPAKIQRQRLEDLRKAALKRNLEIRNTFSEEVTHIVTEHVDVEAVANSLNVDRSTLKTANILNMSWFVESMKTGKAVAVEDKHRVKSGVTQQKQNESPSSSSNVSGGFNMPEYACQRATLLEHLNERFTTGLEILEKYAELRDEEHDYSRALAFRRASCVLKCLPFTLRNINQLRNLANIGDHSKRVIQEILEDGESHEVEDIINNPWYHKMKMFCSVFGVGPSTAKKWIEKGWTSIEDAKKEHISSDWRVLYGLAFHHDLTTPVTREEAGYITQIVREELDNVLPGALMELTGGFRRGKSAGHDVDILITHPTEGKEIGVLPRLLHRLQNRDIILCGRHEKSSFHEEVLTQDFKLTQRGQLDHFEKWLGIIKIPNSVKKNVRKMCAQSDDANTDKTSSNNNVMTKSPDISKSDKNAESQKVVQSLDHSMEDFEPKAKRQRLGEDTDLSPMDLANSERDWLGRRVDLIVSPYHQYYYALVGWTGNKQFNRDLRWYSQRELGMKLTSHGLYDFNKSCSVPACSEREVFDNLKVPYREPWERNC